MAEDDISCNKKLVILIVGMCMNTVNGLNDFFMSPFLPNYHEERGVSVTANGIIFGASPVGEITSAFLLFIFLLPIRNKKTLAISGMLMIGFSQILFGLLKIIVPTNNYVYITLAIILKFAVGFGIGANFSAGMPIFMDLFPEMRGRICSYLTATMGFYCVFLAVIGVLIIPKSNPTESETNDKFSAQLAFNFMSNPGVCVVIVSSILTIATMGFFMSAFSPFLLEKY